MVLITRTDFYCIGENQELTVTSYSLGHLFSPQMCFECLQGAEQCDSCWRGTVSISEGSQSSEGDGCAYGNVVRTPRSEENRLGEPQIVPGRGGGEDSHTSSRLS